jgi:hypothetical protein
VLNKFAIVYAGELIYCKAIMKDDHYEVVFNGRRVAAIAYNEYWNWMLAWGVVLPQEIIAEIGFKIESHYL